MFRSLTQRWKRKFSAQGSDTVSQRTQLNPRQNNRYAFRKIHNSQNGCFPVFCQMYVNIFSAKHSLLGHENS